MLRWCGVGGVPVPEPGMPETAIRIRSVGGMDWNFAGLGSQHSKLQTDW